MRRSDFAYDLPSRLIAQHPLEERGASRLLVMDGASGECLDRSFPALCDLLEPDDLLVFNDTRVIPARLLGRKASGGRVELLVERIVAEREVLAHVRASKSPRPGGRLDLEGGVEAEVIGREGELYRIAFPAASALDVLERHGHTPLPPYIARPDLPSDRERYQTVYARRPGAVAAPTAGLHFDRALLERIEAKGVRSAFLTLHVGAGTFQPVRVEDLGEHRMHREWLEVSRETCAAVTETRARGKRVVAVGTTAVRGLESAFRLGAAAGYAGETDLFIYPGYGFTVVDALVTNFHLPESTLLMLVCAFGGYRNVMATYAHAVAAGYRFFSYGDAMFLTRNPAPDRPGQR